MLLRWKTFGIICALCLVTTWANTLSDTGEEEEDFGSFENDFNEPETIDFRSSCSYLNGSAPLNVFLTDSDRGYLLSHNFEGELPSTSPAFSKVPFTCSWKLLLGKNATEDHERVSLEIVDLDIPESELTEEELLLAEYGGDVSSLICKHNYIKVYAFDGNAHFAEPKLLTGFCGSGKVPEVNGVEGRSLLIEARITQPSRGFRLRFEKNYASGAGRDASGYVFCGDAKQFACPDPTGVICFPDTFMCDGIRDCEGGEDESEERCSGPDTSFETVLKKMSKESGCGSPRRVEGKSGVIRSMGYPDEEYQSNARCYWFISTPPGTHIQLTFSPKFSIENREGLNSDDCLYDSLSFFLFGYHDESVDQETDATSRPIELFSKVCGPFPPGPTVLPHNQMVVTFNSNEKNNFAGFEFEWKAVEPLKVTSAESEATRAGELNRQGEKEGEETDTEFGFEESSQPKSEPEAVEMYHRLEMEQIVEESSAGFRSDFPLDQDRARWPGADVPVRQPAAPPSRPSNAAPPRAYSGKPDPCRGKGVIVRSVSGMLSTPKQLPRDPNQACSWRLDPRLPAKAVQVKVDIRFYDFTVDPSQDCSEPVLEVVFHSAKLGKLVRGKYSCGKKMPTFEEELTATTPKPVTIIFRPGGKRHRFDMGFIVIATRRPGSSGSSGSGPPQPSGPPFALVRNCGKSSAPVPALSFGRSSDGATPVQRIVGGLPAKPGSYPWAVELTFHGRHMCGGTILDDTWILTAAHCFKNQFHKKAGWEVVIGRQTTRSQTAWNREPILKPGVKRIMVHKKYQKTKAFKAYDIALVQLGEKLTNARLAHPACLPSRSVRTTDRCVVVGWGSTKGTGHEGYLKEAKMPIFDNNKCKTMNLNYAAQVTPTMVCAGYEQGGTDSCQGDSGGPLTCHVNGRWELHGVVSFGKGCAGKNAPGVYTRVWSYSNWIRKVTTIVGRMSRTTRSFFHFVDDDE